MITLRNISVSYGEQNVLKNVDCKILAGEFVLITGKSGAGKTTLISLLIGAIKANSGLISVDGIELIKLNARDLQLYRRTIGVVFQDYKLLEKKTVSENVAFALEVCGENHKEVEKATEKALQMVGLRDSADKFPNQLSGGEKQRVAIARAMVHEPKILLADEPTGNLDAENTNEIVKLLLEINKQGTTILLATHDMQLVKKLDKRTMLVKDGGIEGASNK